ncbi:MAG: gliding motility protein GldN [Saprospiraceae bacterium]|nr:gliding motility protein GldN [Saprospiraceae bacterium]
MNLKTQIFSMAFLCLFATIATAQPIEDYESETIKHEKVLDGVYEEDLMASTPPLKYDNIREADVFWEKRIWRVLDVREKMNKPFVYPEKPFINIILEAAQQGDITVYMDEKFTMPMAKEESKNIGISIDTTIVFDPVTFIETPVVTRNVLNWEDIKRFRLKEVWFFDEETSTMQVRIIGIAPLREVYDAQGNFKYEQPMFWAYYPQLRNTLASQEAFNPLNDAGRMSWEDIMEMRYFSSYIYKESNVYDRRLQDYLSGVDLLLEADKIKNEIFNFEHDIWSF